jgi:hypothetical protein
MEVTFLAKHMRSLAELAHLELHSVLHFAPQEQQQQRLLVLVLEAVVLRLLVLTERL